jgi:hypothetical protein
MSGIFLTLLSGSPAGVSYYIGTYAGSGGPKFIGVTYDGTNSYFTGTLSGGAGQESLFIKYNNTGVLQYQDSEYKSSGNLVMWSAASSANYAYLSGYEYDGTYYGSVMQLSKTNGTVQWIKRVRQSGVSYVRGVAVDSSDNVYVSGQTTFTRPGLVLVQYNSSGVLQWQNQFGGGSAGSSAFTPRGITLDSSNNVYVTGYGAISSTESMALVKYDTSGNRIWQRELVFADVSRGYGVKTDSSGNIYIFGWTYVSGTQAYLVAKYNSSGSLQWQKQIVSGYTDDVGGNNSTNVIAIDSANNIYLSGYSRNSSGYEGWAIFKYNSSGTLQWQRSMYITSGSYNIDANSIAVDNLGSFYISSSSDYSNTTFFAKLPVTGALTGSYTISGITVAYAASSYTESSASGSESTPSYPAGSSSIADADGPAISTRDPSLTSTTLQIP